MPNTPEHEDFTGYGLIPLADQVLSFFGLTHNSTEYDALDDAEQALFDKLFPNLVQRERDYRLLSSFGTLLIAGGMTLFSVRAAIYAAGFFPLAVIDIVVSGVLAVAGFFSILFSRLRLQQKVFAAREAVLQKSEMVPALHAYKELDMDRRKISDDLNHLAQQFEIAEKLFDEDQFATDGKKNLAVQSILKDCLDWIKDSQDIMSDDAVNIVKDVLLKQRSNTDLPVERPKGLISMVMDNVSSEKKQVRPSPVDDSLYETKGFSDGWRKLSKLPASKSLVDAVDYDYLVADYAMNRERITDSCKILRAIAGGFLSDDKKVVAHILKKADALCDVLKQEKRNYLHGQKALLAQDKKAHSHDVLQRVVSVQRNTKTPQLIEDTLKLHEQADKQQKIAEQKSAKAQQAALKKHDALVERLNKKFLKQGGGPDDHNAP